MNLESLKARLEKLKEERSREWRNEAFKNNPNGYSVFPGLNEPDTDFECGANEMQDELMPIIERAIEIAEFYSGLADEVWKTEVYSSLWKETKIIDKGEKAKAFLESLKEIK